MTDSSENGFIRKVWTNEVERWKTLSFDWMAIKNWLTYVVKRVAFLAIAIFAVLSISNASIRDTYAGLRDFLADNTPLFPERGTPGILSMEPPQLYTRERLVNDRFRQANWLERQLDRTTRDATIDDIGQALTRFERDTGVVLTLSTAAASAPPPDTTPDETDTRSDQRGNRSNDEIRPEAPPKAAIAGSFGQRLVETDKLRSRLRTDLMDTQLDDGHDLEGNTLYRLNFDAMVMPLVDRRSYPGTAVFVITARNPYSKLETVACVEDACHDLRAQQMQDDIELLREWQTEIQQFLTRVVENRIEDFAQNKRLQNPTDPKEDIALDWFLRRELIEGFLGAVVLDPQVQKICKDENRVVNTGELEFGIGARAERHVCKDWIAETLGLAWRSDKNGRVPDFDFRNSGADDIQASFRRIIRLSDHINRAHDRFGQQAVYKYNHPDKQDYQDLPVQRFVDPESKIALIRVIAVWKAMQDLQIRCAPPAAASDPETLCPQPFAPTGANAQEKLFSILGRYETFNPTDKDIEAARDEIFDDTFNRVAGRPNLKSGAERCFLDATAVNKYEFYKCAMLHVRPSSIVEDLIARFVLARLHNELPIYSQSEQSNQSLSQFVDVSLAGCGTTGCRIQVQQYDEIPMQEFLGGSLDNSEFKLMQDLFQGADYREKIGSLEAIRLAVNDTPEAGSTSLGGSIHTLSLPLDKDGLWFAGKLLEGSETDTSDDKIKRCLDAVTVRYAEPGARAEAYFGCRLRQWVDTKRSDLTIYSVTPRAGSGDDLESSIENQNRQFAGVGTTPGAMTGYFGYSDAQNQARVISNPTVIGFSTLPGRQDTPNVQQGYTNNAVFGWAIRPQKLPSTGRYVASQHRLAAVVSVPSWWRHLEFYVSACWVAPEKIKALSISDPDFKASLFEDICKQTEAKDGGFKRSFDIQLPRRVEEITDRFNFDFIKTPYLNREFMRATRGNGRSLSLEAGRPGQILLHGERLWRGTLVTVNNQTASRIVVLPDMKGVVASFDCVRPPDGLPFERKFDSGIFEALVVPIQPEELPMYVWTAEGSTRSFGVNIFPFVQRVEGEKPCYAQ